MNTYRIFIDGCWQKGELGSKPITSPSTEEAVAEYPVAGPRDLDRALAAAVRARKSWGLTSVVERAAVLRRAASILAGKIPQTAAHMVREQAKTMSEALGELERARETLVWNAENAAALCAPTPIDSRRSVQYQPVGVVAAFTPWNYPAVLTARKLGPALAAGCTVILKAAEEAPAAAVALVESFKEAGLPPGVLNLVFGEPAQISTHLLASPDVRLVTFTGSTRVGKELAALAARDLKTCVLELGGHSPVLVFADADIPQAVRAICAYKFEYAGQSCNAPSRVFVQRARYEEFMRELLEVAGAIRMGPVEDPAVEMGPMIGPQGPARMQRLVDDAVAQGASLRLGGKAVPGKGFFWPVTVLGEVPASASVMAEEPFGPVLALAPFDDVEDGVQMANRSSYGLASYVFTPSEETQRKVLAGIAGGGVGVNMLKGVAPDAPLAGTGDSGYGAEGGVPGFRAYQNLQLINRAA